MINSKSVIEKTVANIEEALKDLEKCSIEKRNYFKVSLILACAAASLAIGIL